MSFSILLPVLASFSSYELPPQDFTAPPPAVGAYRCTFMNGGFTARQPGAHSDRAQAVIAAQNGREFSLYLDERGVKLIANDAPLARLSPQWGQASYGNNTTGELISFQSVRIMEPSGRENIWPWAISYHWTRYGDNNNAFGMAPGDRVIMTGECRLQHD